MTELSGEARALIARSKRGDEPSAADRARLRSKLEPEWAAFSAQQRAEAGALEAELAPAQPAASQLAWGFGALLLMAALGLWLANRNPNAASTALPAAEQASHLPSATGEPVVTPSEHVAAHAAHIAEAAHPSPLGAQATAAAPKPRAERARSSLRGRVEPEARLAANTPQRGAATARFQRASTPQPSAATDTHAAGDIELSATPRDTRGGAATELGAASVQAARSQYATQADESIAGVASIAAPIKSQNAFTPQPIDEELSMLGAAQDALRNQRPSQALRLVEQHAFRFPRGALAQERLAVHTLALCALQRMSQARQMLSELEQAAPTSPLTTRVRRNCGF